MLVETNVRFLEGDMLHRRPVDAWSMSYERLVHIFRAGRWARAAAARMAARCGLVRSRYQARGALCLSCWRLGRCECGTGPSRPFPECDLHVDM